MICAVCGEHMPSGSDVCLKCGANKASDELTTELAGTIKHCKKRKHIYRRDIFPRCPYCKTGKLIVYDPIEETEEYKAVQPQLNALLEELLSDHPGKKLPGFCYVEWELKKGLLREKFGIEWNTPGEMNPGRNFH